MNYLLDTHSFLWFIADDSSLSSIAKELIESPENTIHLSVASIWEIAIKVSLNKLEMPSPITDFIDEQLDVNTIALLQIKTAHVGIIATLDYHHRDPFDRLIIAQSLHENYPVIGRDKAFDHYGITREW